MHLLATPLFLFFVYFVGTLGSGYCVFVGWGYFFVFWCGVVPIERQVLGGVVVGGKGWGYFGVGFGVEGLGWFLVVGDGFGGVGWVWRAGWMAALLVWGWIALMVFWRCTDGAGEIKALLVRKEIVWLHRWC